MVKFSLLIILLLSSQQISAQVSDPQSCLEVQIDSVLKSSISLPSKGYLIQKVKFIATYNDEMGKMGDISRMRIIALKSTHQKIKFAFDLNSGAVSLSMKDTTLYLPMLKGVHDKIKKYDYLSKPKVMVYAYMIIGLAETKKFRDFIVRDVQ